VKNRFKTLGIERHVPRDNLVLRPEQDQTDRIAGMNSPCDRTDLLERSFKTRCGSVAVLHAVRSIQGDDDPGPTFAETRGNAPGFFHDRLSKSQAQQQNRQAAKHEKQNVLQTQLSRTNTHASVEELHRRPGSVLNSIAVQQVSQDW
jgi:hypothetical protein